MDFHVNIQFIKLYTPSQPISPTPYFSPYACICLGRARSFSIIRIFSGLFESLIGDHFVLERNQQVLNGGGILPSLEKVEILDSAVGLVD